MSLVEVGTWMSTDKYAWNGSRSGFSAFEQEIKFKKHFPSVPSVIVALTELDTDKGANLRVHGVADKVTKEGFVLIIKWWSDTHVYSAAASWIATADISSDSDHFPDGDYVIKSKKSGRALDVFEGKKEDCTPLIIYDYHGGANQTFTFKRNTDDGSYIITAKHSGKVLDITGGSMDDCAQLIQFGLHGGDNQRFFLTKNADDGSYIITCKKSKKVLDVTGGNDANCTKVIQYGLHGGANQRWFISAHGSSSSSTTSTSHGDNFEGEYFIIRKKDATSARKVLACNDQGHICTTGNTVKQGWEGWRIVKKQESYVLVAIKTGRVLAIDDSGNVTTTTNQVEQGWEGFDIARYGDVYFFTRHKDGCPVRVLAIDDNGKVVTTSNKVAAGWEGLILQRC